ncbi:MAG: TonB-dependent receptor, partial [Opitutaceae bacterium]
MYSIPLTAKTLRRLALGVLLMPVLTASVNAQTTGSITGRVYDAGTGRSLQGAIVTVEGRAGSDYTTADGRYTLSGLPAGTHTVEIEYVGLDTLEEVVTVPVGGAVTLDAGLESEFLELETYEVRDTVGGQALAINQQKTAQGIINIVSEETFGSMSDGNIGYALQRLPGISVDESADGSPDSINIRGVSGEYNSIQLDGNRLPTSEGSRSFNPRQMVADGIATIEVIKAPTPDQDGDAIGGIINVIPRSAFQREGRHAELDVAGVWSELPNDWGYSGKLNFSDIFSVGGGEKNLGISFTASLYETDRYYEVADQDWTQVDPETNPELNLDQYDFPVWFFEASHTDFNTRTTNSHGLSGSIDFRTDEQNSFYFRPFYSHYDLRGVLFEADFDIDTRFQNQAGGRKTYAELTPTYGRAIGDASQGSLGWIGTAQDNKNDIYSAAFGGRHERGSSLLTYDFYYSRSKRVVTDDNEFNTLMEPDAPYFLMEYEIIDVDGFVNINILNEDQLDPTDLSLMTEGELIEELSEKTEVVYSARLDWEKEFTGERASFTFKTGAKYRVSEPRFDRLAEVFETDEDFPYDQVMERSDLVLFLKPRRFLVYPDRSVALRQTNPELFELVEDDTFEDSNVADYDAKEATSAAYVMGTLQFGPHTIIGGVRLEKNEWDNVNKRVSYLDEVPTLTFVDQGDSYSHWLPGIHFRHELRENLVLRESYNRSYGRPALGQLTRGRFVNEDGDIRDGNPSLEPAISDNFDAQLEYYTAQGGLYSVGFFYKDIKDFTFDQIYDFNVIGEDG